MRAPTVAVCTLAAIAAWDLSHNPSDHASSQAPTPEPEASNQVAAKDELPAPVESVAPPEHLANSSATQTPNRENSASGSTSDNWLKTSQQLLEQLSQSAPKPALTGSALDAVAETVTDALIGGTPKSSPAPQKSSPAPKKSSPVKLAVPAYAVVLPQLQPAPPIKLDPSITAYHLAPSETAAELENPLAPAPADLTPVVQQSPPSALASTLTDIQGHWAQPAIEALAAQGIVQGFKDGKFRPDEPVKPAQLAAMIQKAASPEGMAALASHSNLEQLNAPAQTLVALANNLDLSVTIASKTGVSESAVTPETKRQRVAEAIAQRLLDKKSLNQKQITTRADAAAFVYQTLVQPEAGIQPMPSEAVTADVAVALPSETPTAIPTPSIAKLVSPAPVAALSDAPIVILSSPAALPTPNSKETFEYWANLCNSLSKEQKYPEALAACDQAIALNPRAAAVWANRGKALFNLNKPIEAIASYDRALAINPNYSLVWTERCQALSRLGRAEDALAACDRALQANGDWGNSTPAIAWYNRGLVQSQLGRYEEAIASYDRALAVNPNYSLVWTERCSALSALNRLEDALAACDRAIQANGDWGNSTPATAWYNRGLVLTKLSQPTEAIAAYDRALQANKTLANAPINADIWANRSAVLWQLKRYEEALAALDTALKLDPNQPLALQNRDKVLQQLAFQNALPAPTKLMQNNS
jgi:tetratricopeptide (TPR) repeat protein